ncbi:MAG: type 1 glutamine amidotransferase [Phycisphaeraceae bacterium]|nr:MAG: type 1 glutamine amidotransferase [Phycisphaeraceae bacterium]
MQRQRDPQATLSGMRVAILTGEGLHDAETLMPLAYLQNRGARVTVIGVETGLVKAYNSDIRVRVERSIAEVRPDDFDALVLPGGRAPAQLREHSEVVNFAREFFNSGKPVAAICHGPQILATAGVLEGRNATCIASISDEIREAGARYQDRPVVRDRNLVTSRIPDDIPVFLAMIEATMIEHGAQQQRRPETRPERPATPASPARPGGSPR